MKNCRLITLLEHDPDTPPRNGSCDAAVLASGRDSESAPFSAFAALTTNDKQIIPHGFFATRDFKPV